MPKIIYSIKCKKCNIFYIGQTEKTFKNRIREHLNNIANFNKTEKLYLHFRNCGMKYFSCFVIEKVLNKNKRDVVV